eukprot:5006849-Pyramimonas_sp.AAC.1
MGGTGPIRSPGQHYAMHPLKVRSAVLARLRDGRTRTRTASRAAAQRGATNPRDALCAARRLVSLRRAPETIPRAGR